MTTPKMMPELVPCTQEDPIAAAAAFDSKYLEHSYMQSISGPSSLDRWQPSPLEKPEENIPSRDGIHQYFYNFSIFFLSFF
jgi:hypothetical protein